MNKTLIIGSILFAVAGTAQAQDNTVSSGPFRFGVTAGPANFDNSAVRYERDNPVNRMPWTDRVNAAPSGSGPNLGPEGGGTPMSRGGINDTLTGPSTGATFNVPAPSKPKAAKQTDRNKSADAKAPGEKPKP